MQTLDECTVTDRPVCERIDDTGATRTYVCMLDSPSNDFENLSRELQMLEQQLDQSDSDVLAFQQSNALSWQQFASDTKTNAGSMVLLRQEDFADGTLRIRAPGHFVLVEDIVFRPNPGSFFGPTAAQRAPGGDYPFAEFPLDFHAAIGVESDNVLIDLNGYTLSSSIEWHSKQSFGMLIELGNSVFIVGQGPANFANPFFGPSNVVIRNGVLGFNQHHAIHGNPGSNIYIHNVDFDRYHIAAVALNGVRNAMIVDCVASGTNTQLALLGAWSQAHFLDRFMEPAAAVDERAAAAKQRLDRLVKQAFADVAAHNRIDAQRHPEAAELFANAAGLVDGNNYGLLLTNHGMAVDQFDADFDAEGAGYRIYVKDVVLRDTINSVQETVALLDADGVEMRGPAGDPLAAHRLFDATGAPRDSLDPLTDALLAYASAYARHGDAQWHTGTLYIPQPLIDWYDAGADLTQIGGLVRAEGWRYARNTDSMFHVNKGATGVRLDSVHHVLFENVLVDGVEARSPPGHHTLLPGERGAVPTDYTATDYGHPKQGAGKGYAGHRARGVLLAASRDGDLRGLTIRNVRSDNGPAIDVDTFPHIQQLRLPEDVSVNNHTLNEVNI